jgi:hypothetical protein
MTVSLAGRTGGKALAVIGIIFGLIGTQSIILGPSRLCVD